MNSRIINKRLLMLLLILFCGSKPLFAQFLTIEIEVEQEVNAVVEQQLDFGQIATNSGQVEFNLGEPEMGIFSIRSVRTQRMIIQLDFPSQLQHTDLDASIPIDLRLAISNNGVDNWREASEVTSWPAEIVMLPPPDQPQSEWSIAWLYIYGSLVVGNIPTGEYTGEVFLNVEYD